MYHNKIKIFILGADNINWSIDKDRQAIIYFLKKNEFKLTINPLLATHIICVWYDILLSPRWRWLKYFKKFKSQKIIAVITNNIIDHKKKLNSFKRYVDLFIVPTKKIERFLNKEGFKTSLIPFFVDPKTFHKLDLNKEEICKKIQLDYFKIKNKIIIGSLQRDSLNNNLNKPKWQKNPAGIIELFKKLPKNKYVLLIGGPRRHYLINQCKKNNINFIFYGKSMFINNNQDDIKENNLNPTTVNYLYNLIDVYIVTSKSEGGPKAIIESALTKTLIFSTDVGFARDFIHPDLIYETTNNLIEKIDKITTNKNFYISHNYEKAKMQMQENKMQKKYKAVIYEN